MNLVPQRSGTLGNISYILFPLSCRNKTMHRWGNVGPWTPHASVVGAQSPEVMRFYGSLLLPKLIILIDCKRLLINEALLQTLRHIKQINETVTLIILSLVETFVFRLKVQFVLHVTISLFVMCVEETSRLRWPVSSVQIQTDVFVVHHEKQREPTVFHFCNLREQWMKTVHVRFISYLNHSDLFICSCWRLLDSGFTSCSVCTTGWDGAEGSDDRSIYQWCILITFIYGCCFSMNNQLFPLFLRFVNVQTEPFSSGHWFCFYLFEQKIEAIWSRSSAEPPESDSCRRTALAAHEQTKIWKTRWCETKIIPPLKRDKPRRFGFGGSLTRVRLEENNTLIWWITMMNN